MRIPRSRSRLSFQQKRRPFSPRKRRRQLRKAKSKHSKGRRRLSRHPMIALSSQLTTTPKMTISRRQAIYSTRLKSRWRKTRQWQHRKRKRTRNWTQNKLKQKDRGGKKPSTNYRSTRMPASSSKLASNSPTSCRICSALLRNDHQRHQFHDNNIPAP